MEFGGEEEEEEIELSLGLAIGGCRKRERTEDRVIEAAALAEVEEEVDLVKRKKEMQALRRSEARRKRKEKRRMRVVQNNSLNIQQPEDGRDERREGTEVVKSDAGEDTEQSASAHAFPIYAYPSYQYFPYANGFAIPCIAPVDRAETDAISKIVASQTVSFRPFHAGNKSNSVNGVSEVNEANDEGGMKAVSNGSVGCCSSAVSENRSISSQDGSSSDSASHLSRPGSTKTEQHSSSESDVPRASNGKAFTNPSKISNAKNANKSPLAALPQPTSEQVSKEDSTAVEPKSANVRVSRSTTLPQPNSPGKPPRPRQADNQKSISPPAEMPCVSTTGNGPEGKTITGFLYRYTTTAEVSIVCVCHGESFSPAEFVKHAGGIDIAHPLRHITVVPSDSNHPPFSPYHS